jgi:DNA-directed RNA polymerase subunit L
MEDEEEEGPGYKYLDLQIQKGKGINHYEIFIEGQSHGFLNVLVKHLLNLEGVDLAAYKKTDIEAPKIFIKLKDGHKIKNTLRDGLESLREEVLSAQKTFKKLI